MSYLFLIENDLVNAEKYASISIDLDRYNSSAKINKANVNFLKGNYSKAKEYYLEVISLEADNINALYNLALVNKKL